LGTTMLAAVRLGWWVVGIGAAVLCAFNALALVGTTAWELASPESIDVAGPPPWLVLTPWILSLFILARWALRRSEQTPPTALERHVSGRLQTANVWMDEHLVVGSALGGVVVGGIWWLLNGWRFALALAASWTAARMIVGGLRRRRSLA
jgi:hypothetical protein